MVASVGLLVVGGCTSGGSEPGADGSDAPGALEVWSRGGPEGEATYGRMFDLFTEQTGIEVEFTPVPEFDTQLQSRASQRDLPDVFINDAGSLGNYAEQGLLLPVDRSRLAGADQIPEDTWAQNVGLDGETYAVPFSRQANVTMVRRDWREKLGLDVPTTWAELEAMANAFATQDPDGNGEDDTYGMVVPGSAESGYLARWGVPYLWQGGGELLQDNGDGTYASAVNSPGTVAGMQFIRDQFCTPGNVVPGSINFTTADAPFFQEGTAGIYLTGGYNLTLFDTELGRENVEAIPMPAGPEGTATFAEGENVYLGAGSDKPQAQLALAEFMITAEAQEIGMDSPAQGGDGPFYSVVRLPVNSALDAGEIYDDERWQLIAEAYAGDARPFPWNIDFIPFRQILADGMNRIMADCSSDIPAEVAAIDAGFTDELANQELSR